MSFGCSLHQFSAQEYATLRVWRGWQNKQKWKKRKKKKKCRRATDDRFMRTYNYFITFYDSIFYGLRLYNIDLFQCFMI